MAKGQVIRGTPVHHISSSGTAHEGISPRTPRNMEGTVDRQYDSDRRGYQADARGGTPYHSEEGNGPEFKRVRAHGTNVESADHGNQNDPHSNGKGVMLDVGDQASGYSPASEHALDSPVPSHAAKFNRRFIQEEDAAHLGSGLEHLAGKNNDLRLLDGVMSRGMVSTSKPGGPEDELAEDDTLRGSAGMDKPRPIHE